MRGDNINFKVIYFFMIFFAKNLQRIRKEFAKNLQRFRKEFAKNSQRFAKNSQRIRKEFAKNSQRIRKEFAKISQRFAKNLQRLCKEHIYFFIIQEDFVNVPSFSILFSFFNCEIIYLTLLFLFFSLIFVGNFG